MQLESLHRGHRHVLAERFSTLWKGGATLPDVFEFLKESPRASPDEQFAVIEVDIRERWRVGLAIPLEDYLEEFPGVGAEERLKLALIACEYRARQAAGDPMSLAGWAGRFPELAAESIREALGWASASREDASGDDSVSEPSRDAIASSDWDYAVGGVSTVPQLTCPGRIGKYIVEKLLAAGGFKQVYLARDEGLDRTVAIKIPHRRLLSDPRDIERFVDEARILAGLEHPHIVPVYDFDHTPDGLFYVVEKFVTGTDLGRKLEESRPSYEEAAELLATVAEALDYVHEKGLVHRDIKPANILLERDARPLITDFGLALRQDDSHKAGSLGGTLAYMSPEQARSEAHLVDRRSDLFSLGVVLYEVLTGTLPFRGESPGEVLERIRMADPVPPREIDPSIPRPLEAICLRALSKRAAERHASAQELAQELRSFLETADGGGRLKAADGARVVPKGLRSFESSDAGFFPQLVPGPRDAEDFPACLRFWKTRVEERDPTATFRVGLIYGPSGCGKSSLIKAGLLPCLASYVLPVHVEASADGLEDSLLSALRQQCPGLPAHLGLVEALAAVRRGRGILPGRKVLLVLDQFEQWLHGRRDFRRAGLVAALRQCDGEHLQCILSVRDDFWMAITAFLHELDVRLLEGENSQGMDLFDFRHARKVLALFGQSFGALPQGSTALSRGEESFLARAVSELGTDGKVVPVRLALFAEMVKARPWRPATLKELGGAHGVGVRFLEDAFTGPSAPPERRLHEKAARAVLEAMLPADDAEIRGVVRSRTALVELSNYAHRRSDFDELLRVLDQDLRLLTPVERRTPGEGESDGPVKCYQLTHDYLVPVLREWLTRARRSTRRGRAELLLAERAALWGRSPERRHLPTLVEWLKILCFARPLTGSVVEKKMMASAALRHIPRVVVALVALAGLGYWGEPLWTRWRVARLLDSARASWEAGRDQWGEACGWLGEAARLDPRHPRIESLMREISSQGYLVLHLDPEDAVFEVAAEPGQAEAIVLELPEGHPADPEGGPLHRSGEKVPLVLGHYRVRVLSGGKSFEFPLFVGQVRFRKTWGGWRESGPIAPAQVAPWTPASIEGDAAAILADALEIEIFLPEVVPEGYVFVPPGPFWCSDIDDGFEEAVELEGKDPDSRRMLGWQSRSPKCRRLENGFVISRDEVSIAEFKRWIEEFGDAPFLWEVEYRARHSSEQTWCVSLEELKTAWGRDPQFRERLAERGVELEMVASKAELCRLREYTSEKARAYLAFRDKFFADMAKDEDETLPVGGTFWHLALLYARTCHFDPGAFRRWVELERKEGERLLGGLSELRTWLRSSSGPLLHASDVPLEPRLPASYMRLADFREETPIKSYLEWLSGPFYRSLRFAAGIPSRTILDWARENRRTVGESLYGRLDAIELQLSDRLFEIFGDAEDLIDVYIHAVEEAIHGRGAGPPVDRASLAGWLEVTTAGIQARLERLAAASAGDAPLDLRLAFGHAQGWGLPTPEQWEKAFRGADDRSFPWGSSASRVTHNACLGPDGYPSAKERNRSTGDVSPYEIYSLAGNVSEWVLTPPRQTYRYAKGGNFKHPPAYANVRSAIAVYGRDYGRHVGIRVVRELARARANRSETPPH